MASSTETGIETSAAVAEVVYQYQRGCGQNNTLETTRFMYQGCGMLTNIAPLPQHMLFGPLTDVLGVADCSFTSSDASIRLGFA